MTAQISRIGRRAHRLLCQTRRQENVIVCTDRALRHLPDDAVTWIIINASKEQISRVIVDAAVALVKAEKGRAAIAVVDHNGNLISMDSMDGNSRFWSRFAVGKAVRAVALQVDTAVSAEEVKTNPTRFKARGACCREKFF